MSKTVVVVGIALLVAGPVLAQRIVDAPTSPDDPLSKVRGWVEKPPQSATAPAQAARRTSHQRSRSTQRLGGRRDGSTAVPDNSASKLNQQELGRLSTGGTPP